MNACFESQGQVRQLNVTTKARESQTAAKKVAYVASVSVGLEAKKDQGTGFCPREKSHY